MNIMVHRKMVDIKQILPGRLFASAIPFFGALIHDQEDLTPGIGVGE